MKPIHYLFVLVAGLLCSFSQGDRGYVRKIEKHRKKMDAEFRNPEESPLRAAAVDFRGIDYFPPNPAYRVSARLERTPEAIPFSMPTSNPDIQKKYVSFGVLHFKIKDETYQLRVYRSLRLAGMKEYKDHLFLPFRDQTSGQECYGGGRYLDLTIPKKEKIIIDFNLCYNPYCAYSEGWSCPIPPEDNYLETRIEAGPRQYQDH